MTFSATDAAFEGFRQVRRHPVALVFWVLAYVVVLGLGFVVAGPRYIELFAQMETLKGVARPDPAELEVLFRSLGTLSLLILPLALIFGSVVSAGVARAVLRPTENAFGYLRLGSDELRVIGVTILLYLVVWLAYMVGAMITAAIAAVAIAGALPILWLVVVLAGLATVALVVWLSVRLSLAVPIVVAERRFTVFASFGLTKGLFWPLFGMAIIAGVMTLLVGLLGAIVLMPLSAMTGGNAVDLAAMAGRSVPELIQAFGPMIAVAILINSVLSALQLAVLYAPFSAAYRGIKGLPDA